MQAAVKPDFVTVDDYIAGEEASDIKHEYVLISQDRTEVTIFRRATNWEPSVFTQSAETVRLDSISLNLPLADVYAGVSVTK